VDFKQVDQMTNSLNANYSLISHRREKHTEKRKWGQMPKGKHRRPTWD